MGSFPLEGANPILKHLQCLGSQILWLTFFTRLFNIERMRKGQSPVRKNWAKREKVRAKYVTDMRSDLLVRFREKNFSRKKSWDEFNFFLISLAKFFLRPIRIRLSLASCQYFVNNVSHTQHWWLSENRNYVKLYRNQNRHLNMTRKISLGEIAAMCKLLFTINEATFSQFLQLRGSHLETFKENSWLCSRVSQTRFNSSFFLQIFCESRTFFIFSKFSSSI